MEVFIERGVYVARKGIEMKLCFMAAQSNTGSVGFSLQLAGGRMARGVVE